MQTPRSGHWCSTTSGRAKVVVVIALVIVRYFVVDAVVVVVDSSPLFVSLAGTVDVTNEGMQ